MEYGPEFFDGWSPELARDGYELGNDARDWKVKLAQNDFARFWPYPRKDGSDSVPILLMYATPITLAGRGASFACPAPMLCGTCWPGRILALMMPKQHKDEFGVLATKFISAHKSVAAYDTNYHFPLYLYPTANRDDLFAHHETSERQPNLSPELVASSNRGAWPSALARRNFSLCLRRSVFPGLPR